MYALQLLSSSSSTSFFFCSSVLRADKSLRLRPTLAPTRKRKDSAKDSEGRLVLKSSLLNLFSQKSTMIGVQWATWPNLMEKYRWARCHSWTTSQRTFPPEAHKPTPTCAHTQTHTLIYAHNHIHRSLWRSRRSRQLHICISNTDSLGFIIN